MPEPMRKCEQCGEVLVQRQGEYPSAFQRRRYCSATCSHQSRRRRKEHGVRGYRHGCRCPQCSEAVAGYAPANALANATRRRALQEKTLDTARNRGEPRTSVDLDVALREDMSTAEKALLLGRTHRAVRAAIEKARTGPKWLSAFRLKAGKNA